MDIKVFAEQVIEKQVLLSIDTANIWITSEDVSDIIKLIFLLFKEPLSKEKNINFQHELELQFDHLTEMVKLDLSKLPLEKVGVSKVELVRLLNEYDEITHKN